VASFGELLRQHRVARGFSQETLAELARLSTSAIGALERGSRRAPYRESVALLADALQLSGLERAEFETAADRGRGRASRVAPSTVSANNLPVPLTSFVGRDEELVAIARLLRQHRLVTITGSGGAGKTRIALELAAQLLAADAREMWFVDLSRLTNGTFVANTVAELLDVSIGESAIKCEYRNDTGMNLLCIAVSQKLRHGVRQPQIGKEKVSNLTDGRRPVCRIVRAGQFVPIVNSGHAERVAKFR